MGTVLSRPFTETKPVNMYAPQLAWFVMLVTLATVPITRSIDGIGALPTNA